MQEQVHLAKQIRERLGFAAPDGAFLQELAVSDGFDLFGKMVVGLDQKPAGTGCRIKHGFAEARVGDFDHEPDHRARRVEFARVARGVAHFAEHGFVQGSKSV